MRLKCDLWALDVLMEINFQFHHSLKAPVFLIADERLAAARRGAL